MWFWQNFENWMQTATFLQRLQNWEFRSLWKRWGRRVFVESRTFKCAGERNDHMLHYDQLFGNLSERRESKYCVVLMKNCCKAKAEQVITLQIAQKPKTKNINVVSGQLFCCECKATFFLGTDSLYWWSR